MKKSKLITIATTLALVSTLLISCSKGNNGKVTIACDSKFAPFSYEKDGKYEGIDVDILDAIAKEENIDYELKPMDFGGIIPALTSNQIDGAIAAMSITDKRKESLDFSDGYFQSGLSLVVKGDNDKIKSASDLNGKTVSVKKGTEGEKWAMENESKYSLTIKHFDDSAAMFLELENGGADFSLEDYPVIAYKIKTDGDNKLKIVGDKLNTSDYGFAVNKGKNADLLKKFNDGLKTIKGNGKYDEILSKYLSK